MRRLDAFVAATNPVARGRSPMYEYASRRTPEDRRDVAAYLASRPAFDALAPTPIGSNSIAPRSGPRSAAYGCASCHGDSFADGPNEVAPNLTLQEAPYIFQQLMMFSQEVWYSTVMESQAYALTDAEMTDLAAYIDTQDPLVKVTNDPPGRAEVIAAGENIALNGLPDRGVPSCLSCHVREALGALPMLPRLHGHNAIYLEHRLTAFGHPLRTNGQDLGTLTQVFEVLNEREIEAVSAYFASLEPLTPKGLPFCAPT